METVNQNCINCPKGSLKKEGNCRVPAPDGYTIRCGPPWTIHKHRFIDGYCEIFVKGARRKFKFLGFIDLFSGPGLYYQWPSGILYSGSPINAQKYDFDRYYYIDLNNKNIEALKFRLKGSIKDIRTMIGDANQVSAAINKDLPYKSLSFCLADPENMSQLKFNTLKELSNKRHIDLLINFPYGTAFKRGAKNIIKFDTNQNVIDEYFGTDMWQDIFRRHHQMFSSELFDEIINLYLEQFYKIGYLKPDPIYGNNYRVIKNTTGRGIYHLVFLSKDQLGYKFWTEAIKYIKDRNIEMRLL